MYDGMNCQPNDRSLSFGSLEKIKIFFPAVLSGGQNNGEPPQIKAAIR